MSTTATSSGYWWAARPNEKFWLEVTNRPDIGADLKAPSTDDSGASNWRYTLLREVRPGDIVYHYSKPLEAITGRSIAASEAYDAPITWAARGTYAREKGTKPHERPGIRVDLQSFAPLPKPLQLATIRAQTSQLRELTGQLAGEQSRPIYFPFEISSKRPIRPLQGYIFKLPSSFVQMFGELDGQPDIDAVARLSVVAAEEATEEKIGRRGGQGFRASAEQRKAVELYAMLRAREYFHELGFKVEDTSSTRPYDLVATKGQEIVYIEVKGTTTDGETVFLTRGEVEHCRKSPGQCALFIVRNVQLHGTVSDPIVSGGSNKLSWPWVINESDLQVMSYSYTAPIPNR